MSSAPHEIQRLLSRHFQIIDLTLAGNGPKEIAQALDMSPQAVSLITKSPIFQSEISRRRDRIEKQTDDQLISGVSRARSLLEENAERAVQTHVDLLDPGSSPDPKVRQASASKILDLVLGGETKHAAQVIIMEPGAIQLLQLALLESGPTQMELAS